MVHFLFKRRKFKEINFFKILLALVIAFEQTINEVNVTSNPATDSTSLWLYLVRIGHFVTVNVPFRSMRSVLTLFGFHIVNLLLSMFILKNYLLI